MIPSGPSSIRTSFQLSDHLSGRVVRTSRYGRDRMEARITDGKYTLAAEARCWARLPRTLRRRVSSFPRTPTRLFQRMAKCELLESKADHPDFARVLDMSATNFDLLPARQAEKSVS